MANVRVLEGFMYNTQIKNVLLVILFSSFVGFVHAEAPEELLKRYSQFKGAGLWQEYSVFEFTPSNPVDGKRDVFHFETANNELLITLEKANGEKVFLFLMPNAVYMSKNLPEQFARAPDTLEYFGLQSQLFLFFLETAFPEGPGGIEEKSKRIITEESNDHEIRFLSGVMRMHPSWQAEVTIEPVDNRRVNYRIVFSNYSEPEKKRYAFGYWSNEPKEMVLEDSESLDGWIVNYHGARSRNPEGGVTFEATLGNTDSFSSVGDIRKAKRTLTRP
jgi:hypothetical protein